MSILVEAQMKLRESIYSPAFYSSKIGYIMRLRLFPNGDSRARGTHISLFLELLPNDHSTILPQPLHFPLKTTAIILLQSDKNQARSFCFPIGLDSSQRADFQMDSSYGISKCFPLDLIEQNIHNAVLFIKIIFNVSNESSGGTSLLNKRYFVFDLGIFPN